MATEKDTEVVSVATEEASEDTEVASVATEEASEDTEKDTEVASVATEEASEDTEKDTEVASVATEEASEDTERDTEVASVATEEASEDTGKDTEVASVATEETSEDTVVVLVVKKASEVIKIFRYVLRGIDTLTGETTPSNGFTLLGKNLLPEGANTFLYRIGPLLRRGLTCSKQPGNHKSCLPLQNGAKSTKCFHFPESHCLSNSHAF